MWHVVCWNQSVSKLDHANSVCKRLHTLQSSLRPSHNIILRQPELCACTHTSRKFPAQTSCRIQTCPFRGREVIDWRLNYQFTRCYRILSSLVFCINLQTADHFNVAQTCPTSPVNLTFPVNTGPRFALSQPQNMVYTATP